MFKLVYLCIIFIGVFYGCLEGADDDRNTRKYEILSKKKLGEDSKVTNHEVLDDVSSGDQLLEGKQLQANSHLKRKDEKDTYLTNRKFQQNEKESGIWRGKQLQAIAHLKRKDEKTELQSSRKYQQNKKESGILRGKQLHTNAHLKRKNVEFLTNSKRQQNKTQSDKHGFEEERIETEQHTYNVSSVRCDAENKTEQMTGKDSFAREEFSKAMTASEGRISRVKRSEESTVKKQCPNDQPNSMFSADPIKCLGSHCGHVIYECDLLCSDQNNRSICELHHCTGSYDCLLSNQSIPDSQICDGTNQCPGNDDEHVCTTLEQSLCVCLGLRVTAPRVIPPDSSFVVSGLPLLFNMSSNVYPNETNRNALFLSHAYYLSFSNVQDTIPRNFLRIFAKLLYLHLSYNMTSSSPDLPQNEMNSFCDAVLNDIKGMVCLLRLDLSYCKVLDLPHNAFYGLSSLIHLDLSQNSIRYLSFNAFNGLSSLIHLDLSQNSIRYLYFNAFNGLSSLIHLDLSHNDIPFLSLNGFNGLSSLIHLDLSQNNIIAFHVNNVCPSNVFNGLSSLIHLDLSHNRAMLGYLLCPKSFNGLSSLTDLNLSHNNMPWYGIEIPTVFTGLSSLTDLDLSHSNLEGLSSNVFIGLSSLIHLNMSHCKLNLPTFNGLSSLIHLDLSHSNLFDFVPTAFNGLPSLIHLDLSYNDIRGCRSNTFYGLSSLIHLDLSQNNIRDFSSNALNGLSSLTDLDLSHNNISVFSSSNTFNGLTSLTDLDLSHNNIHSISSNLFNGLSSLIHLDLSQNNIRVISSDAFNGLSSLTDLDLSANYIQCISLNVFNGMSSLVDLDLSHNYMYILTPKLFNGLSSLIHLDLSINGISYISPDVFKGLSSLINLDISDNSLDRVSKNDFSGLSTLSSLNLSDNGMSIFPAFPLNVNLTKLDLSHNNFTHIPSGAFLNCRNIELLNIIGNPLVATEDMFDGLDKLQILLTNTRFVCCVKPKSVNDKNCLAATDFFSDGPSAACELQHDAISSFRSLISSVVLRVFLWMIGACAVIGNVSVIVYRLIIDRENFTKSYSVFVFNLGISDCFMGVYLLVIGVVDVHYQGVYALHSQKWRDSLLCSVAGVLSTVSSEMSTFLVLVITIDRLILIVFPMSRLTGRSITWKKAIVLSLLLWIVSITLAVIPTFLLQFYFKGEFYSQSGVCLALPLTAHRQTGSEYSVAIFVGLNSIIFAAILVGQVLIFIILMKNRIVSSQHQQREMEVAKTLFLVVVTDFFCWCPIGVMGVMTLCGYDIPDYVYAWVMVFVLPVNAAVNPFLYTLMIIWRRRQRAAAVSTKQ